MIAKAFPNKRDEIVIATKVGYDFVTHGEARGRGQREIPQDFSPDAIVRATEAALKRLKTDRIDLLQLHNIRMEQVDDDAVWKTLEQLKGAGKIRYYGIALDPPSAGCTKASTCIREREITSMQHIYNMLEQHPGRAIHDAATETGRRRCFSFACRIHPECLRENTMPRRFSRRAIIARHRPRSWLLNGVKKIEQLRFSKMPIARLGQAALQWLLADDRVASTLPNIYNEEQLIEFAKAPEYAAAHQRRYGTHRGTLRREFRHRRGPAQV